MGIIPHITVQIDNTRRLSAEGITTLSLGFGLLQAWVFTAMYAAPMVFNLDELTSSIGSGTTSLAYLASALAYTLLMGAAGCLDHRLDRVLRNDGACIIAGICSVLGTLMMLEPAVARIPALEIGVGALTGVGTSYLALIWGCRLSRLDPRDIALNAALSCSVGFVVFAIVVAIPRPLNGVAAAMLPMGSTLAVIWHRRTRGVPHSWAIGCAPRPLNMGQAMIHFCLPVFVFGIALALLKQTSSLSLLLSPSAAGQVSIVASACIAFVLFLLMAAIMSKSDSALRFFKPMVPLIAISAPLALISTNQPIPNLSSMLFLAVYICFHVLLWDFFGELCQRHRLSPVRIFGWGRCLISLSSALIALPNWPLVLYPDSSLLDHSFQVMFLPIVVLIAFVLLPSASRVESMVRVEPSAQAKTQGAAIPEAPQDQESAGSSNPQAQKLAESPGSSNPDQHAQESADDAASNTASKDEGETGRKTAAPEAPNAPEGDRIESKPVTPSLTDQCQIIANQYQLSARETEVLMLLARGRNASYIMEHLFISEGTTKTHMRHIYRKLDVHSQQELIQLVQEASD